MNIIALRQEKRRKGIGKIKASIEKSQVEYRDFDFKSVVMSTMSNLEISGRTASEYVRIAFFELNLDKNGNESKV